MGYKTNKRAVAMFLYEQSKDRVLSRADWKLIFEYHPLEQIRTEAAIMKLPKRKRGKKCSTS